MQKNEPAEKWEAEAGHGKNIIWHKNWEQHLKPENGNSVIFYH
ncbi:MAG: hypothetical protein WCO56_28990 [Verrucomicrobiota bacterium]